MQAELGTRHSPPYQMPQGSSALVVREAPLQRIPASNQDLQRSTPKKQQEASAIHQKEVVIEEICKDGSLLRMSNEVSKMIHEMLGSPPRPQAQQQTIRVWSPSLKNKLK